MALPYIFAGIPPAIVEFLITTPKIHESEGIPVQAKIKQISITDIYSELEEFFQEDKPKLIRLFEEYIDLSVYIPQCFYNAYYKATGHPRDFKLTSILSALIVQKILSIPETSMLINFLSLSKELRDFCGLARVPDAAQFTRFRHEFEKYLNLMFEKLVETTEPICQKISSELANIIIVDTTGIEGNVKENNPKFFDTLLRSSKIFSKNIADFNAHTYACGKMPKQATSNPDLKFSYMNGHYCYSMKTAIVSNGLGIIRHIDFYEDKSKDLSNAKTANEAKDEYDAKTLIPVLRNYFNKHSNFSYKYFLGDAGFDAYDNYKYLVKEHNIIPIIPINPRGSKDVGMPGVNEDGIPTCPNDPSLLMKHDGTVKEKGRPLRIKWLCPKTKKYFKNGTTQYECTCENSCTTSKCGRIHHTYPEKDYRMNTVVPRSSELWKQLFKTRTIIERSIYMLKYPMGISNTKLSNTKSLKSDILLAAITQQLTLILASKLNQTKNPLSIKQFVA